MALNLVKLSIANQGLFPEELYWLHDGRLVIDLAEGVGLNHQFIFVRGPEIPRELIRYTIVLPDAVISPACYEYVYRAFEDKIQYYFV